MKKQKLTCRPNLLRVAFSLLAAFTLGGAAAKADVRMPGIFGDHMVLQQDMKIPVWGWADPNEKVVVKLGNQTASATAAADGKWRVDLSPVPSNSAAQILTVTGNNSLTFNDVLVGDVWLCSGQSNMEFPLKMEKDAATEVPAATDPQIRLFIVERRPAFHPQDDLKRSEYNFYDNLAFEHPKDDERSVWKVCTPDMASQFTAVGYLFAKELRGKLNRPIGMIASYWGGSPGGAWMSLESLKAEPALGNFYGDYASNIAPSAAGPIEEDALYKKYFDDHDQWQKDMAASPGKADYDAAVKKWQADAVQAQATHQPPPPRPTPPFPEPHGPPSVMGPTVLYNGMIAPLIPYGIKGVLWYQGETNTWTAGSGLQYRPLLARLISSWRESWGEGDFPFLIVQLANNNGRSPTPVEAPQYAWAWLRESQLKTLTVPNTGLAVAIDLGASNTIHPPDKQDVAHRLVLAAEHVAYGQDVIYSGPIYDSMKIEGNAIRVSFTQLADGLKVGVTPWIDPSQPPISTTELKGFAIAGADKNWVWADAKIDGRDVVVSSSQVPNPVAVRYGWLTNPSCNLYNTADLPASPFRTDDW